MLAMILSFLLLGFAPVAMIIGFYATGVSVD